ncbi:MAG: hypothetical protein HC923_08610, partial [Myxococcales bacterium]|nr:hypothetical protein [Myxococcales bacterium]
RVTTWGPEGRARLRIVALAERPDRFRIETLSPFEEPLDVVATNGQRLYWLSREHLKIGPATSDRIGEVLPLPLAPDAVVDVLLGGVPSRDGWQAVDIAFDEGDLRLMLRDERGRVATAWVAADEPRLLRVKLPPTELQPAIDVRWEDHREGIARKIAFEIPDRDLRVDIRLDDVRLDEPIPEARFQIDPPPGRRADSW